MLFWLISDNIQLNCAQIYVGGKQFHLALRLQNLKYPSTRQFTLTMSHSISQHLIKCIGNRRARNVATHDYNLCSLGNITKH